MDIESKVIGLTLEDMGCLIDPHCFSNIFHGQKAEQKIQCRTFLLKMSKDSMQYL